MYLVYGNEMHNFILDEMEFGTRVAEALDDENNGDWGPLWDAIYDEWYKKQSDYMSEEDDMPITTAIWTKDDVIDYIAGAYGMDRNDVNIMVSCVTPGQVVFMSVGPDDTHAIIAREDGRYNARLLLKEHEDTSPYVEEIGHCDSCDRDGVLIHRCYSDGQWVLSLCVDADDCAAYNPNS